MPRLHQCLEDCGRSVRSSRNSFQFRGSRPTVVPVSASQPREGKKGPRIFFQDPLGFQEVDLSSCRFPLLTICSLCASLDPAFFLTLHLKFSGIGRVLSNRLESSDKYMSGSAAPFFVGPEQGTLKLASIADAARWSKRSDESMASQQTDLCMHGPSDRRKIGIDFLPSTSLRG